MEHSLALGASIIGVFFDHWPNFAAAFSYGAGAKLLILFIMFLPLHFVPAGEIEGNNLSE
jgi:hypothetical protein